MRRGRALSLSGLIMIGGLQLLAGCVEDLSRWDNWDAPHDIVLPARPPAQLTVVSYNVFLLPKIAREDDEHPGERAAVMARQLGGLGADVVALQETWAKAVGDLVEGVEGALPVRVVGKPGGAFKCPRAWPAEACLVAEVQTSGGLTILSRWPIRKVSTLEYASCHGDDCLANKGALHVVVQVSAGASVQLVTTHLDAGDEPGDVRARASQLRQLRGFINTLDLDDGPLVLLGDLNIDSRARDSDEYDDLLGTLDVRDTIADKAANSVNGTIYCDPALLKRRRLDYIVTRSGESGLVRRATHYISMASAAVGDPVCYLSDHKLIMATFETRFR